MATMRRRFSVLALVLPAMALNPFVAAKKKTTAFLSPLLMGPTLYLGVMGAPIYGRGLPGAGGLLDFDTLAPRTSPNEYLAAPADEAPKFDDDAKREVAPVFPVSADDLKAAFEAMLAGRAPVLGDVYARPTLSDEATRRHVYVRERRPIKTVRGDADDAFLGRAHAAAALPRRPERAVRRAHGADEHARAPQRVRLRLLRRRQEQGARRRDARGAPGPAAGHAEVRRGSLITSRTLPLGTWVVFFTS